LTLLLAAVFIAQGAIEYHVGATPAYVPQTGVHQAHIIRDLRAGTLDWVDPARLAGLLTFPSFHAASAVLFIWGAWPIRWLRGPMLAVNLAMLAATPIEGGHYLVDIFGGMAMAALGIASLRFTRARTPQPAAAPADLEIAAAPAAAGVAALG
jgi:membrane-associated phospholipid phosphatase